MKDLSGELCTAHAQGQAKEGCELLWAPIRRGKCSSMVIRIRDI